MKLNDQQHEILRQVSASCAQAEQNYKAALQNLTMQVMLVTGKAGFSSFTLKEDGELVLHFPEENAQPETFQKEVKKKFAKKNLDKAKK
jgi:hypothetical protein